MAGRLYCLRCFQGVESGAESCAHCGYANDAAERRRFWNRAPRVALAERVLKIAIIASLVLAYLLLSSGFRGTKVRPGAYLILAFLFLGLAGWQTVSKLTRRRRHFHATTFWMAVSGISGGFLLWVGQTLPAVGFLLAALLVLGVGRTFAAWKRRLTGRTARPT